MKYVVIASFGRYVQDGTEDNTTEVPVCAKLYSEEDAHMTAREIAKWRGFGGKQGFVEEAGAFLRRHIQQARLQAHALELRLIEAER